MGSLYGHAGFNIEAGHGRASLLVKLPADGVLSGESRVVIT